MRSHEPDRLRRQRRQWRQRRQRKGPPGRSHGKHEQGGEYGRQDGHGDGHDGGRPDAGDSHHNRHQPVHRAYAPESGYDHGHERLQRCRYGDLCRGGGGRHARHVPV